MSELAIGEGVKRRQHVAPLPGTPPPTPPRPAVSPANVAGSVCVDAVKIAELVGGKGKRRNDGAGRAEGALPVHAPRLLGCFQRIRFCPNGQ